MGAFRQYRARVRDEWIDYNEHLNDGCYAIVLGDANELLLAELGVSDAYRTGSGHGMYTVEAHLRYLAEVPRGATLTAESMLVDADSKRLRVHTLLQHDDRPVATGEHLYLHVHASQGAVVAFPPPVQERVDRMLAAHADLERPAHLGLGLGAHPAPRPA